MKWFPEISFNELPEPIQEKYNNLLDLIRQHGMPKLGRWVYCKYCYKKVLPKLAFIEGFIQCSKCGAGLAPLEEVIRAGSLQQWESDLEFDITH